MKNAIIENFERTVRDYEMIGTFDVADRPLIEAEYKEAKRKLEEVMDALINSRIMLVFIELEKK